MHAHTAVFTDEEMGGESSNTANTKVNPNSLGSPRSHQNYDGNAGKWVDGRSSRLPWDDADREYYRPSPTPRHVPSTTNNFEIRALPERERRSDTICGMPKWVASIVFLGFLALAITIAVSVIMGWNMVAPRVQMVNFQFPLPYPYSDATGRIPVISTLLLSNFNRFRITTWPTTMQIFALPSRSPASLLATAPVQFMQLAPHQKSQPMQSFFDISNINGVEGGVFISNAIISGDVNYMYTTSIIRVRAWALNFIPVTRSYKSDCTIMRRWGVNPVTTSDCFGHFIR